MANRLLPTELKRDIERLIALMLEKGDPGATRHILKLKRAMDVGSPVIDSHVNVVVKNALTPGVATFDLTHEERYFVGEIMLQLEAWREGKPVPPNQY